MALDGAPSKMRCLAAMWAGSVLNSAWRFPATKYRGIATPVVSWAGGAHKQQYQDRGPRPMLSGAPNVRLMPPPGRCSAQSLWFTVSPTGRTFAFAHSTARRDALVYPAPFTPAFLACRGASPRTPSVPVAFDDPRVSIAQSPRDDRRRELDSFVHPRNRQLVLHPHVEEQVP